jgi:hypothetical protein
MSIESKNRFARIAWGIAAALVGYVAATDN